ncbi:MAG TPA: YiiX/YebB-like N1pC/P60 family cysteine hydrolase [Sunxiuqinia sp.]|nr:YiiX/YebB-like N1pC/P60 family cysteine hydrolase [Sunxiuqinia sp.]
MKKLILIMNLLAILGLNAFGQPLKIKTGDLLFRETVSSNLSQAIDQVTQTGKQTHFSHIGIADVERDTVFVLHASPIGGTCKITLNEFSHPEADSVRVVVYRLKKPYRSAIPSAIKEAKSLLGKPYNFSYILSDSSQYCSEFIYRAFEADSIFKLNPMTFKDPATREFAPTWVDYYKKLGLEIPEGKPGCNPNGMAASDKIERIGEL